MDTVIQKWFESWGYTPVIASDLLSVLGTDPVSKYLSRLNGRMAATMTGKILDRLSDKYFFKVKTLFGTEDLLIRRVLNGSRVLYQLTNLPGDSICYEYYSPDAIRLIDGRLAISIGRETANLSLSGVVEMEEVGYKDRARYTFINPERTKVYYVRQDRLTVFCNQIDHDLKPAQMSMLARGARKNYKGWIGYRNDKPDVRKKVESHLQLIDRI